jgi:hypothetical protein
MSNYHTSNHSVPTNEDGRPITPDSGGYNVFAVLDDGDVLCHKCVENPSNPVHTDPTFHDGWCVIGWDHTGNLDEDLYCGHCASKIGGY